MKDAVTVLAPIKLAKNRTEVELIEGSNQFQAAFVSKHPEVIRRELIKMKSGEYMDIVQFSSAEGAQKVIEAEAKSEVCREFFALMDFNEDEQEDMAFYPSLATYYQTA